MIKLDKSLQAWGKKGFRTILKAEIESLSIDQLPLQKGLTTGNYVSDAPITVAIHSVNEMQKKIIVKAGIFYQGIIGGCSCTDDPTPTSDINEYCEVQLEIDKVSANTVIVLVSE